MTSTPDNNSQQRTTTPEPVQSLQINSHSLPVVITLFLLSFFFIGFFSIYFVRCVVSLFLRRSNSQNNNNNIVSNKSHGLDPSIVSSFPTFVYSSVKKHRRERSSRLECAVCLSEFNDDDVIRLITMCNHSFHPECIDLWLECHTTCPVCRLNLDPSEKSPEVILEVTDAATTTETTTATTTEHGEEQESGHMEGNSSPPHHVVFVNDEQIQDCMGDRDEEEERTRKRKRRNEVVNYGDTGRSDEEHATQTDKFSSGDDRFTLRLPEHVKETLSRGHTLTVSCTTFGDFSNDVVTGKDGPGELSRYSVRDAIKV
ncbi:hypothetical protein MKW94_009903 [Papaver nudicaule]|uniref:RING-type E3 ubiquitin transferase n=1 Tax=Papaver nudicaule TaxID=74823 RepID=A0AA41VMK6_PAPNU|nr:hypothetical protein [Papaver nudicaule]